METLLRGTKQEVAIGPARPTVIIGERINPSHRERLARALAQGDMTVVCEEARAQVEQGAHVIDVNVSVPGIDEKATLVRAIEAVAATVDVPICIDTADAEALAAALVACPGRHLVNSVSGDERSLESVLPLVQKHGTVVVGLAMDEGGISNEPARRLAIAGKIVARAEEYGIPRQDVIIDCLALTLGADYGAAAITLETIRLVSQELGVNTTVGISNISFGLPDRELLNNSFLAMGLMAGLTSVIVDPAITRRTILAADLIRGHDRFARSYIGHYRARRR